jgi:hypothetical protein
MSVNVFIGGPAVFLTASLRGGLRPASGWLHVSMRRVIRTAHINTEEISLNVITAPHSQLHHPVFIIANSSALAAIPSRPSSR